MEFLRKIEDNKPHEQKQKEIKDKNVKTLQQIRKLDKVLAELNFDVIICLRKIYFGLAGDKEDIITANQTLLEVGIDNQNISIQK